jgi:hypothetical protein
MDVIPYFSGEGAPMGNVPGGILSSTEPAKTEITWEGLREEVRSGVRWRMKAMRE